MEKNTDLQEIQSVSIREYFTGWGEFARDGVDDFLAAALPEDMDAEDVDAVREVLDGKLTEEEVEAILEQIEDDYICQFQADITTVVNMQDGTIEKKYSFEAD